MTPRPQERILVALDTPDADEARRLASELRGTVGGYKVGLQLYTSRGPSIVRDVAALGAETFLDLKLHDIPNTVGGATAAAARLGVTYLTLHALGGPEMIQRAVQAAAVAAVPCFFNKDTRCGRCMIKLRYCYNELIAP